MGERRGRPSQLHTPHPSCAPSTLQQPEAALTVPCPFGTHPNRGSITVHGRSAGESHFPRAGTGVLPPFDGRLAAVGTQGPKMFPRSAGQFWLIFCTSTFTFFHIPPPPTILSRLFSERFGPPRNPAPTWSWSGFAHTAGECTLLPALLPTAPPGAGRRVARGEGLAARHATHYAHIETGGSGGGSDLHSRTTMAFPGATYSDICHDK